MKLAHISDLHIGKRVNGFSMLEEQADILKKISKIAVAEECTALLIAGDIYDKAVPSAEAVSLFDEFITELSGQNIAVLAISGNHDSPERIAFASRLLGKSGVHMSPVFDGEAKPICLSDEFGSVFVYLLPFVRPVHVRSVFPEAKIESYTDAVRCAVENMQIDTSQRNILVAHQFVTGAVRCDSEDISVGGLDNVDASVFSDFDYTALGHIHSPQNACGELVRYCGTPLKYSFSEAGDKKSVTVIELREKGSVSVSTVTLEPLRELREIRGSYDELTRLESYTGSNTADYIRATLLDEEEIPDAIGRLRAIYPNIMQLVYDNRRTRTTQEISAAEDTGRKTPLELFEELYFMQNNSEMSDEQRSLSQLLIEKTFTAG